MEHQILDSSDQNQKIKTMLSQFRKILFFSFFSIVFFACDNNKNIRESPESFSSYVYAYTSGEISKAAPIRIQFTNSLIASDKIGAVVDDGIVSFQPRIDGEAIWEDDRTIYFKPNDYLPAKEGYIGKIILKKLFKNVPKEAKVFEFDFQVKEQNFYVRFNGLRGVDPEDSKKQRLEGYVSTNDIAESEDVEKLLKVEYPEQKTNIRWEHSSDKLRHDFFIENIIRNKEDSELLVEWNGKPLGVNVKSNQTFVVPGINNFQIMDARVVQGDDQYVQIFFSDPLLKSQNFDGLVTISGYTGKLRFTVDGNQLLVYPSSQLKGERIVGIERGLKNFLEVKTKERIEWTLLFEEPKPALRLVGNGVIIPESEGLIFPFEAINLNAVDIEVFKIYNNNILQYLQSNQIDGYYQLEQVGRIILQKQISLTELNPGANKSIWTRFALDLSQLMETDPNSIYQIRLGFRPEYSSYKCEGGSENEMERLQVLEDPFEDDGEIQSIWDYGYYGYRGYYSGFDYEHRENPCFPAYYNADNFIRRNVLASNLGILAKSGTDGEMLLFVTDLRSTKPIAGINLDIYDYQQQVIKSVTTDGDGMAKVDLNIKPFVVVANRGTERGYLKLLDPNALSLSKFDVSGTYTQKGIKGYIYGERGVWRPGDSLYLNFVLEDKSDKLPENHPITFELYDSRNQLQQKFTTSENVHDVYPLAIATAHDAPTGNWRANVQLGGAFFTKTLKIETVKPNRLKIKLDFGKEELNVADMPMNSTLQINWLHGAPARNLKAKIEMQLRSVNTTFPKYSDYEFDDPARYVSSDYKTIFDGPVNDNGEASIKTDFSGNKNLPGKMKSDFRIRAFEKGGGYSEDNFSVVYHPFDGYAGVSVPRNRYGSKRIDLAKGGIVNFATVNTKGEALKNRKLKIGLYRAEWRWWWENDNSNISLYNTSSHFNALDSFSVTTDNKGAAFWNLKVGSWGRYLVRVCDEASGHCSGEFFYAGYPWWGEDSNNQHREAAAMLMFSSDKKKYNVGENVELRLPSSEGGRALISIESGSKVLSSEWIDTEAEETIFSFKTSPEMAPTVYANVTMIQPHAQSVNDLPIRMYGVIPINVEDPDTRLKPAIKMADVLKPEEKVKIEVNEESGRAMVYTIAVVDDGLLDLTRFKTPNPWDVFYAREALGVKTWDVYDHVLGAYGGQLEQLFSIGGDGEVGQDKGKPKANRFKPVVQHFGPFYLKKGGKAEHEFVMPNYVGSVRTMVVASNNGAYGSTEKTTPVRKPLMVLTTLPRVIGPGERLKVPVNVFAMEDKVKNVNVKIQETSGLVKILGNAAKEISFSRTGDQMVDFEIEIPEKIGVAKFIVTASGAGEKATQEIEIDIRNPNPFVTDIYAGVLENGEKWNNGFSLPGVEGTNSITLEVSNIPPLNVGNRLGYLIRYPHGCVEQTTSSAFPQLYVTELMEVDAMQKKEIPFNIKAAIEKLKRFQNNSGGFSYWPGDNESNTWGTTYAGHFLLEAKNLGYNVSEIMINRWVKFQQRKAKNWTERSDESGYYSSNNKLIQAYRLYTLALAGKPEFGAMNRLRESRNLPSTAKWRLAAAYALAGKPEVGKQIIGNLTTVVENYTELSYTYGSQLRDQAMILEALIQLKDKKGAAEMVVEISDKLGSDYWYNTQAVSYSLLAMGKFTKENKLSDQLKFAYQIDDGKVIDAGSQKSIMHIDIPAKNAVNRSVSVSNKNNGIIYARLIVNGQPVVGDQTEASNHLAIKVLYKTTEGQTLNPDKIPQGTDFIAEVSITNPGTKGRYYKEMALTQIFPSGWEITNTRMTNVTNFENTDIPTYQDIRDDRVYSYFNIRSQKTQTYRVQLNAAYQGRYYLPSISCEAMYDHTINARKKGKWVEVVPADGTIASK